MFQAGFLRSGGNFCFLWHRRGRLRRLFSGGAECPRVLCSSINIHRQGRGRSLRKTLQIQNQSPALRHGSADCGRSAEILHNRRSACHFFLIIKTLVNGRAEQQCSQQIFLTFFRKTGKEFRVLHKVFAVSAASMDTLR